VNPAPALEARGLALERGGRRVLAGVSLRAHAGEALLIRGANGCGKTSLLRALAGFLQPAEGEALWRGAPLAAAAADTLFIGHEAGFRPELTARENLQSALTLAGEPAAAADSAIERAGLATRADAAFGQLSAGQRRRLALARLFATTRRLWLLDEPATALDDAGVAVLEDAVAQHLGRGGVAVVTTHRPLAFKRGATHTLEL
jgi:heme exporter protein A